MSPLVDYLNLILIPRNYSHGIVNHHILMISQDFFLMLKNLTIEEYVHTVNCITFKKDSITFQGKRGFRSYVERWVQPIMKEMGGR